MNHQRPLLSSGTGSSTSTSTSTSTTVTTITITTTRIAVLAVVLAAAMASVLAAVVGMQQSRSLSLGEGYGHVSGYVSGYGSGSGYGARSGMMQTTQSTTGWEATDSPHNKHEHEQKQKQKHKQKQKQKQKHKQKHPLEDDRSWDLHLERRLERTTTSTTTSDIPEEPVVDRRRRTRRRMESATATATAMHYLDEEREDENDDDDNDDDDDDELPFTIRHKPRSKHIPFAGGDTTHGIMIDAGSQGTRLHIYEWNQRFLLDEEDLINQMNGMKLSYPTSNNRWTDKYTPGLDAFGSIESTDRQEQAVRNYLGALLDFAKQVLKEKEDTWDTYPIYLKATGGLRTLPQPERVRLLGCVRKLFHDPSFNPFDFEDERARVISGEEEAIYGWVGVNFAKGRLIQSSRGSGTGKDPKLTYGMLEMGGASTQIASFENNGDLMANLFKLQLGGARHWNVYVHSYLYFGINGAWSRFNGNLLHGENKTTNPCLPLGSSIEFDSWIHVDDHSHFLPRSDPRSMPYTVTMQNFESAFDFRDCSDHTRKLLRKETNHDWCDFQMDGNCGFAGIYQPPMPKINSASGIDEFIATSNFYDVFAFLQLGERATIAAVGVAAEAVCKLPWDELREYNAKNPLYTVKRDADLAQFCFRSIFVYHLLRNGWEFGDDYELTAVDVIDGHKLGWALGCMLYEINTLPWDFHPELLYKGPNWLIFRVYVFFGTLVGSLVGLMIATRVSKSFNRSIRESMYFKTHPGFANNPVVRKTLSLPDVGVNFDELERLYREDDQKQQQQQQQQQITRNDGRSNSPMCCSSSGDDADSRNERTELANQSRSNNRVTYNAA